MHDGMYRKKLSDTPFIDLLVVKQNHAGTQQPVVMQSQYHRDIVLPGYKENGGRGQRYEIVNMDDIGFEFENALLYDPSADRIIYDKQARQDLIIPAANILIVEYQALNLVAVGSQQLRLVVKYRILSTRLLILIMDGEDSHLDAATGEIPYGQ
jgi:hypothetical protein